MIDPILEVKINEETIELGFTEGRKSARYQGKLLFSLEELVQAAPFFPKDLETFMKVCNFFFGGLDFLPIKDIAAFQTFYEKQFMEEEKGGKPLLKQYGHFDVGKMHPPKVQEGKFIGFVQSTQFGVPYRLTCDYPFNSALCSFSYTLLPLTTSKLAPR